LDVIEFFLSILRTIIHIFDISTDLMRDNHKIVNAILGFILAGCLIYFFKIDSISNASPFPLALFFTSGIYLQHGYSQNLTHND
jgi:hypothetical protein